MSVQDVLYPSFGNFQWKASEANAAALPATGNVVGDARVTDDTGDIYVWGGSAWINKTAAASAITALTGDATAAGPGSVPLTLATVNGSPGSVGSSTSIPTLTVNAKGLVTAASGNAVIAPAGTLTGTTLASVVTASSLTSLGTQAQALNMGTHQINAVVDPSSAQDAATKNYVDSVASGLNPKQAVYAATIGSNIVGTYVNGVAGVGATFTVTATGAFTLDGTTPPVLSRILIKDQTSGFQNGVYDLTVTGSLGVSPILTRSLDYNTPAEVNAGDLIPVINGTVNSGTTWLQTATVTTIGTDALVFQQWSASAASYLLKANNLSDVASKPTSFNNISPMTTGGDLIYGGASGAGTRLANGTSGQVLTSAGGTAAPTWATPTIGAFAFGSGSDGNVTISGTVTLTRDMYYNNLTFTGAGNLKTSGFRVFVSGILDMTAAAASAITATAASAGAGNAAGTGGSAGAIPYAAGTIGTSTAGIIGGAGGVAAGTQGAASTAASPGMGGPSGGGSLGGTGSGGAGGAVRAASAVTNGASFTRYATDLLRGIALMQGGSGAPGGSGGGGDGTAGGGAGGGGAGGGIIYIAANQIKTSGSAASAIQAIGGAGGAGATEAAGTRGGGGGGPGGGGGWVYIAYGTKVDAAATNLIDVSGGAGAAGGNGTNGAASGGAGGGGGGGGRIDLFNVITGVGSETFGGVATASNAQSAGTGGAAKAGQVTQVSF